LKQISEHNKIWGAQKNFGVTAPECPPCLRYWAEPSPESFPLEAFMFVQGDRHSENVFLIHNTNNICQLCKLIINIFPQIRIVGSYFPTKHFWTSWTKGIGS